MAVHDPTKPSLTQDMSAALASIRENDAAIREGSAQFTGLNVLGLRLQSFLIYLFADGGDATLKHAIRANVADGTAPAASLRSQISGASATLAATPQVAAGVDFVSGLGVDAAAASYLVLNSGDHAAGLETVTAKVDYNTTNTALNVVTRLRSMNVNGVTRTRVTLQINNAATGVAFPVTYANLGAGKVLGIRIFGFIA